MEEHPAPKVYLTVPCYNEASILRDSLRTQLAKLDTLQAAGLASAESAVLCIDDGSADDTWAIIADAHRQAPERVLGIKLAANCGHQKALLAGLMKAKDEADCAISIDADLQDDIGVLDDFLREYRLGVDIVYGVRSDRSSDSLGKRLSAEGFYHFMAFMGAKVVFNHADYRLMSRRALRALSEYPEVNLFLRGIVPMIGLRQSIVSYVRKPTARKTHYTLKKMLILAWDGVSSFSIRPIRMISLLGLVIMVVNFLLILWYLHIKWIGAAVPGWTTLVMLVLALSSFQLLGIGLIGEYIGKIYLEVKRRPRYIAEDVLGGKPPTP